MLGGSENSGPTPLVLSDHFRCGVKEIDDEHAELVDILNAALRPTADLSALTELLQRFSASFLRHCRNEEAYLRSIGYTRLDEHSRHHDDLNGHVATCRHDAASDLPAMRRAILALRDAFADHVLYDLQYKSHIEDAHGR